MKTLLIIYRYFNAFGIYPLSFIKGIKNILRYIRDCIKIKLQKNKDFPIKFSYPCLFDKEESAGTCKGQYFHQDLLVAQRIFKRDPEKHVDIGSRIDGFIAHLATFRKVEVLDIRKMESKIKNIKFKQADLMNVKDDMKEYTSSISCLHAIEHFGLGRYGDSIDINGHIKGLDNIYKILKKDGIFYFGIPIGQQRIEFNAHRIFSIKYLINYFEDKYKIEEFSYVDDNGDLHENVEIKKGLINNFGLKNGCGIFILRKK